MRLVNSNGTIGELAIKLIGDDETGP